MKKCIKCLEEKEFLEFSKYSKKKDGLHNKCKSCMKIEYDKWHSNRSEEQIIKTRLNYNKNYHEKKKNSEVYKEKKKVHLNNWRKKKRETDPSWRLKNNLRGSISTILKERGYSKKSRSYEIIGCEFEYLYKYIEDRFESWMTWDNYGKYNGSCGYGWDVDHIIPLSSATTEYDILKLNHYTNLQPLCSYINRDIKKDNIINEQ